MRVRQHRPQSFLSVDQGVPSVVQVDMDCRLLYVRVHSCKLHVERGVRTYHSVLQLEC